MMKNNYYFRLIVCEKNVFGKKLVRENHVETIINFQW